MHDIISKLYFFNVKIKKFNLHLLPNIFIT